MYFEFVLKVRERPSCPYQIKYRCIAPKSRFDFVREKYLKQELKDPNNSILLINELDVHGDFVQVIQ